MVRYKPTISSKKYYVVRTKGMGDDTLQVYSSYMSLEKAKKVAQYLSGKQGQKWIIMKKIGEVE